MRMQRKKRKKKEEDEEACLPVSQYNKSAKYTSYAPGHQRHAVQRSNDKQVGNHPADATDMIG